jgi:hypothetical protein
MSAGMKLSVSDSFVHVSNDAQLLMIECFAYNSSKTQQFCLISMYWRGKDEIEVSQLMLCMKGVCANGLVADLKDGESEAGVSKEEHQWGAVWILFWTSHAHALPDLWR